MTLRADNLKLLVSAFEEQFPQLSATQRHRGLQERVREGQALSDEDWAVAQRMYYALAGSQGEQATPFSQAVRRYRQPLRNGNEIRSFLEGGAFPASDDRSPSNQSPADQAYAALRWGLKLYLFLEGQLKPDNLSLPIFLKPEPREYPFKSTLTKFLNGDGLDGLYLTRLAQALHLYFSRTSGLNPSSDNQVTEEEGEPSVSSENESVFSSVADTLIAAMNGLHGSRLLWDGRTLIFEDIGIEDILELNPFLKEAYEKGETLYLCNDRKTPKYRGAFLIEHWSLKTSPEGAPWYLQFKKDGGQMLIQGGSGAGITEFSEELIARGRAKWAPSFLLAGVEHIDDFRKLHRSNPHFLRDLVRELDPSNSHPVYYLATPNESAFQGTGKVLGTFRLTTERPEKKAVYVGFEFRNGRATLIEDWTVRDHEFLRTLVESGLAVEDPMYSLKKLKSLDRIELAAGLNPDLLKDWARLGFDQVRTEYYLCGSTRGTLQDDNGNIVGGLSLDTEAPTNNEPYVKISLIDGRPWITEAGGNYVYKLEEALVGAGLARLSPYLKFQRIRHLDDLISLLKHPESFRRFLDFLFNKRKLPVVWIYPTANKLYESDGSIQGALHITDEAPADGTKYIKVDMSQGRPVIVEARGMDTVLLQERIGSGFFDEEFAYREARRHRLPKSVQAIDFDGDPQDILSSLRTFQQIRELGGKRPSWLVELANEMLPRGQSEFYICSYHRGSLQMRETIHRGLYLRTSPPPAGAPYVKVRIYLGEARITGGDGNYHLHLVRALIESGLASPSHRYALNHFESYDQLRVACEENPDFILELIEEVYPAERPQAVYIFRGNRAQNEDPTLIRGNLDIRAEEPRDERQRLPYVKIDLSRKTPTIVEVSLSDSYRIADALVTLERDVPEVVRDALPLSLDITLSDLPKEQEIGEVVKAIVEQDTQIYPGGDARRMATSHHYMRRWYRLGTRDISLNTLAIWLRIAKGFKANDFKNFGNLAVVRHWKTTLFQIQDTAMSEEELRHWIEKHKLGDVVESLMATPEVLEDFIWALYPRIPQNQLGRVLAGLCELGLSGGFSQGGVPDDEDQGSVEDPLILALMRRRAILEQMSTESIRRMVHAMRLHFEAAFNQDPGRTIVALEQIQAQVDDPRVKQLIGEAVAQFRAVDELEIPSVATELKPFQKEGAEFLAGRDAAILADEPGMGKTLQAIAAAELLRQHGQLRGKVLIICPASVKKGWATQLSTDQAKGGHMAVSRNVVLVEGEASQRRELALNRAGDADYVIVNYEYLVKCSDEEKASILKGVFLKIVDEAQMVQNPSDEVQRARAVRAVQAEKNWYLTATPYYGRVEHIWTLLNDLQPGQHGTLAAFREGFTKSQEGWVALNRTLQDIMLRRVKRKVIGSYDRDRPVGEQPLLLPEQRWVPKEEEGGYLLSAEQQAASLLLLTDFETFWQTYGDGEKRADEVSTFARLNLLFTISHNPQELGINGVSAKLEAMDEIVKNRIEGLKGQRKGQKIVIYTNRRSEAEALAKRYEGYGSVLYWGNLPEHEKERRRLEFQDGNAQIIVGTEAMMLGIDLTAGDCLVFSQLPDNYTEMYQMADRLPRLDTRHRKHSVDIIRMVGSYAPMESPTEEEAKYLRKGSYDELLSQALLRGQNVFHMIMDLPHVFDMARLDAMVSHRLEQDLFPDVKGYRRKKISAGETFYPLYVRARSFDPQVQNRVQETVVKLAMLYTGYDEAGRRLVESYVAGGDLPVEELELIGSLYAVRHKNLKSHVLDLLPLALDELHRRGLGLDRALADAEKPQALHILAWLAVRGEAEGSQPQGLLRIVDALQGHAEESARKDLEYRLSLALLKLMPEREGFAGFYLRNQALFIDTDPQTVVSMMEQLSTTALAMPDLMEMIFSGTFTSLQDVTEGLDAFKMEPYQELLGLNKGLIPQLRRMLLDKEPLEGFLDLARHYTQAGLTDELGRLKEIFHHVVQGDFPEWRKEGSDAVPYRREDGAFWNGFNEGFVSEGEAAQGVSFMNQEIVSHFQEMLEILSDPSAESRAAQTKMEVPFVWKTIRRYLLITSAKLQDDFVQKVRNALDRLEQIQEGASAESVDFEDIRSVFGLTLEPSMMDSASAARHAAPLSHTLLWFEALGKMRDAVRTERRQDFDAARAAFTGLKRRYQTVAAKEKSPILSQLADLLDHLKHRYQQIQGKRVLVEDTDDWRPLLNVGQLFRNHVNCMTTTGDTYYTKALIDMLGSRNKRMILVRDADNPQDILSAAFLKVRKDSQDTPVLHVERPFGTRGYKYMDEILAHVDLKREKMQAGGAKIEIGRQILSKRSEKEAATEVFTTGSIGRWEHTEDVFDVWQERTLKHPSLIMRPNKIRRHLRLLGRRDDLLNTAHLFRSGVSGAPAFSLMPALVR